MDSNLLIKQNKIQNGDSSNMCFAFSNVIMFGYVWLCYNVWSKFGVETGLNLFNFDIVYFDNYLKINLQTHSRK